MLKIKRVKDVEIKLGRINRQNKSLLTFSEKPIGRAKSESDSLQISTTTNQTSSKNIKEDKNVKSSWFSLRRTRI